MENNVAKEENNANTAYPDEIYAEVVTQGWDLINPTH